MSDHPKSQPSVPNSSGDSFNFTGTFSGSIINIKGVMTNVRQEITGSPNLDAKTKSSLEDLVAKLEKELEAAKPEDKEAVDAVGATLQTVTSEATKPNPNKTLLNISAEGLKQAAQNLAVAMPGVFIIVGQIVDFVKNLK